jgi:hypothetical protein
MPLSGCEDLSWLGCWEGDAVAGVERIAGTDSATTPTSSSISETPSPESDEEPKKRGRVAHGPSLWEETSKKHRAAPWYAPIGAALHIKNIGTRLDECKPKLAIND